MHNCVFVKALVTLSALKQIFKCKYEQLRSDILSAVLYHWIQDTFPKSWLIQRQKLNKFSKRLICESETLKNQTYSASLLRFLVLTSSVGI